LRLRLKRGYKTMRLQNQIPPMTRIIADLDFPSA